MQFRVQTLVCLAKPQPKADSELPLQNCITTHSETSFTTALPTLSWEPAAAAFPDRTKMQIIDYGFCLISGQGRPPPDHFVHSATPPVCRFRCETVFSNCGTAHKR